MIPDGQINIRNEFNTSNVVDCEVLNVYIRVFIMADDIYSGFGHSVIHGGMVEEHLSDFACLGTH